MTSSYGYQRPLSNEEQLFLQNQALRAELQRREGEQNALDAVAKTALTVGGLALGAAGARSLLRRGKTPISTRGVTVTDLGSIPTEDVRRASTTSARTVEVATSPRPAPSQPAPKTYSERLAQNEEFTRRALAERPQPVRQGNLSELVKQVNIQDLGPVEQKRLPAAKEFLEQRLTGQKTDLPTARTPGTFREFSREASGVAAAERLIQDPELLSLVKAQEAQELSEARSFQAKAQAEYRRLITEEGEQVRADLLAGQRDALAKTENTIQSAAQSDFGPQSYLRTEGYVAADNLVDQHQARALGRIDQFANAANPAEDQATGRVKMALQRNEDVNLAAIEMAEDDFDSQIAKAAQGDPTVASVTDLDSAINQAASTLPDGLPVDQAENLPTIRGFGFEPKQTSAPLQRLAARSRAAATPTDVSLIGRYPPVVETVPQIGRFPGALGSSAGEAVEFTQAVPGLTNVQRGGVEFTVQEGRINGEPARATVLPRGTSTEGISFAEPAVQAFSPEEAAAKLAEFNVSREAQIQNAMARGLSEARAKRNVQMTESQRAALESTLPSYSSEDVLSRSQVKTYGDVGEAERFSEEAASRSGQLKALEEGGFLAEQQDPGSMRVEPQQVRRGVMIAPASRTSYRGVTGRPGEGLYGTVQPVPAQQLEVGTAETFGTGAVRASKDIKTDIGEERGVTKPERYFSKLSPEGRETPEGFVYTGLAMSEPTRVSQRELVAEALQQATASPEGDVPIPPSLRELTERQSTPVARRSLGASQDIMRIMKSAPPEKAQQLVAEYISKLQG